MSVHALVRRGFSASAYAAALLTTLFYGRSASADGQSKAVEYSGRLLGAFIVLPFTGDPEPGLRTTYYVGPQRVLPGFELRFAWPLEFEENALDVGWGGLAEANPSADGSLRLDSFVRLRHCPSCGVSPYAGFGGSWGRTVFHLDDGRRSTAIGRLSPFAEIGARVTFPHLGAGFQLGFRGEYLTTDQHARTPLATIQVGIHHRRRDRLALPRSIMKD